MQRYRTRAALSGLFLALTAANALAEPKSAPASAPAAGVSQIVRVNMVTADIERLRNFYCDLLGFTVKFDGIVGGDLEAKIAEQWRLPPGAKVRTVILASRDGYTQIGLTSAVGAKVPVLQRRRDQPMTGGEHYMILAATNILPLIDKLRAAGVEFWRPTMSITGGHEAGIYDPDGTRIIIEEGGAP